MMLQSFLKKPIATFWVNSRMTQQQIWVLNECTLKEGAVANPAFWQVNPDPSCMFKYLFVTFILYVFRHIFKKIGVYS